MPTIEDEGPNIASVALAELCERTCRIAEAQVQRDSRALVSALDTYRKIMTRYK
jgi:hypothetical protein